MWYKVQHPKSSTTLFIKDIILNSEHTICKTPTNDT